MKSTKEIEQVYESLITDVNQFIERLKETDNHLGKTIQPRLDVIVDKVRKRGIYMASDMKRELNGK